jgi:hypothetical protein
MRKTGRVTKTENFSEASKADPFNDIPDICDNLTFSGSEFEKGRHK